MKPELMRMSGIFLQTKACKTLKDYRGRHLDNEHIMIEKAHP